jgi:hypothetical protein
MKFLSIYKPAKAGGAPTEEHMAEMGKLIQELSKAGVLLGTEGCLPTVKGARLKLSGGKITVTDGPYIETNEVIGGFALLQVNSKEEVIELTKRFLKVAGDGECEIRQVYETPECA